MTEFQNREIICKKEEYSSESLIFLHVDQIRLSLTRKRSKKSENACIRMASSIRKYGILQAFLVKITADHAGYTHYQLVTDEERFRAVCLAGVEKVPCRILPAEDPRCKELSFLQAIKEKKQHFFDEAADYARLISIFSMKQAEIAEKLGVSQSAVANKLRLLQMSSWEQEGIRRAGLGERHARALLRISDLKARRDLLEAVILNRLSVAETEAMIDDHLKSQKDTREAFASSLKSSPEITEDLSYKASDLRSAEVQNSYFYSEPAGLKNSNIYQISPIFKEISANPSTFSPKVCSKTTEVSFFERGQSKKDPAENKFFDKTEIKEQGEAVCEQFTSKNDKKSTEQEQKDEKSRGSELSGSNREKKSQINAHLNQKSSTVYPKTPQKDSQNDDFSQKTPSKTTEVSFPTQDSALVSRKTPPEPNLFDQKDDREPSIRSSDLSKHALAKQEDFAESPIESLDPSTSLPKNPPKATEIPKIASEIPQSADKSPQSADKIPQSANKSTQSAPEISRITTEIPPPIGICPAKFALRDLQPLYSSIEKTLSIFRKTGITAECTREESSESVKIHIKIPKKGAI